MRTDQGRFVRISIWENGTFKIFRIPCGMRDKPLTGYRYLRIFSSTTIVKRHIPDDETRRVILEIKAAARSQFNIFPFALAFQNSEPDIEKIMACIEKLFPNDTVVFVKEDLKPPNCTCERCTRCGNCVICLTF